MRGRLSTLTVVGLLMVAGLAVVQVDRARPVGASVDPEVWIGSPFDGQWASSDGCPAPFPSYACSEPAYHSVDYYPFDGTPRAQSWATDIGGSPVVAGTPVYLYAAPQVTGVAITTKVDEVGAACAPGHGSAGQVVVIGIYTGATKIGTVAYAHVVAAVTQGQTIDRWGTQIGTVGGGYTTSTCWKGLHLHLEMGSTNNYSCYNGGLHFGSPWGDPIYKTNFVGFIGGNRTSTSRQQCPGGASSSWSLAASPNPSGATNSLLAAVSCPSATNCFAVGAYQTSSAYKALVEHWNGTTWAIITSPNPSGSTYAELNGVTCTSTTSCIAVGDYMTGSTDKTMVEHWNGTTWSIVTSPNPTGSTFAELVGVTCPGTTSCFTLGSYRISSTSKTLIEHWNGTTWSIVTSPNPSGATNSYLYSAVCTITTSCFAVGGYQSSSSAFKSFVEHWNGTNWSIVVIPNPTGSTDVRLDRVACSSTTSCFAVGDYQTSSADKTLVEHWNGGSWSIVASPNPTASFFLSLGGVACPTTTNCFAVGEYQTNSGDNTLVEHWNGTNWAIVTSPSPTGSTFNPLYSLACSSATSCFAVGLKTIGSHDYTLIERYG